MKKQLVKGFVAMAAAVFCLSGCSGSGESGGEAQVSESSAEKEQEDGGGEKSDYKPSTALTLVVCASAGGDSDISARLFAEEMNKVTGVPVVVSNVGGGSGAIGIQNVLDAGTDGNTALFYHSSLTAAASAGSIPGYVSEDFDIISCVSTDNTTGWYVSADSPYQNLEDVIEAAKAAPDTINYATEVGAGTYATMLMFEEATGVDIHPADVGNAAEKCAALLSGTVDIISAQWAAVKDYVESGQFRCIGYSSDERPPVDAETGTFKEQGVEVSSPRYFIMAFAKGTDEQTEEYWSQIMKQICTDSDFQQKYADTTGAVVNQDPEAAIDTWIQQEDYYRTLEDMMRGN